MYYTDTDIRKRIYVRKYYKDKKFTNRYKMVSHGSFIFHSVKSDISKTKHFPVVVY